MLRFVRLATVVLLSLFIGCGDSTGPLSLTVKWLTVEQLFELARSSYGEHYERVRVEYHPELGYPMLIDLSCSADMLDCGLTIEVKNLGGLPSIQ